MVQPPWFSPPPHRLMPGDHAVVLGAGIAGCATAAALAEQGIKVTLLEKEADLAPAASGNPAGVILPAISLDQSAHPQFYELAYKAVLKKLNDLTQLGMSLHWHQTGIVHLCIKSRFLKIHAALCQGQGPSDLARALTSQEASALAGVNIETPALHYPDGGWLNPKALCRVLSDHEHIKLVPFKHVHRLSKTPLGWALFDKQGEEVSQAKALVLANAADIGSFEQVNWLQLVKSRGQLTSLAKSSLPKFPKVVVCYKGYLIPNIGENHLLGATSSYANQDPNLDQRDQDQLIQETNAWLPELNIPANMPLKGRVAFRSLSPDHLPIVGPAPDAQAFGRVYADLHHGQIKQEPGPYHQGLYINCGHGGRGLVSAWLAGQTLACQMMGLPAPIPSHIADALNPARFIIRELKRKPADRKSRPNP